MTTARAEPLGRRSGGFRRAAVVTYLATAAILSLNLVTGIAVARALGAGGRGELTAITAAPLMIAWIAAFGANQAVVYHHARHPEDARNLLATWAALLLPLGLVGIAVGELLIPILLSAQTSETARLAHLYMLVVALMLALEPLNGMVLGDHDFGFFNAMRIGQPLVLAVLYLVLWSLGHLTVAIAVLINAAASALLVVALGQRVLRRHGFGRPSRRLARTTFWYGARAHGDTVGALANSRLDLLILPAFLGAAGVGLYSVATNVAGMVVTICASLSVILMPTATRQGAEGSRTVIASLQATLVLGFALAAIGAVFAGPAIRLVYGEEFAGSVAPLRLLLPGTVLFAAAIVVAAGLYALDRPFSAFLAQFAGAVITVPGLILFLDRGGIEAAAAISTISYAVVFAATLFLYRRVAGIQWRDLVAGWTRMRPPMPTRLRRAG